MRNLSGCAIVFPRTETEMIKWPTAPRIVAEGGDGDESKVLCTHSTQMTNLFDERNDTRTHTIQTDSLEFVSGYYRPYSNLSVLPARNDLVRRYLFVFASVHCFRVRFWGGIQLTANHRKYYFYELGIRARAHSV